MDSNFTPAKDRAERFGREISDLMARHTNAFKREARSLIDQHTALVLDDASAIARTTADGVSNLALDFQTSIDDGWREVARAAGETPLNVVGPRLDAAIVNAMFASTRGSELLQIALDAARARLALAEPAERERFRVGLKALAYEAADAAMGMGRDGTTPTEAERQAAGDAMAEAALSYLDGAPALNVEVSAAAQRNNALWVTAPYVPGAQGVVQVDGSDLQLLVPWVAALARGETDEALRLATLLEAAQVPRMLLDQFRAQICNGEGLAAQAVPSAAAPA